MDEEELKFLSKHKHIYSVTDQLDFKKSEVLGKLSDWFVKDIHIQKFPIIYLSKHRVYYKVPGSETPQWVATDYIHSEVNDDIRERALNMIGDANPFHFYFWELNDEEIQFFKSLVGMGDGLRKERMIKNLMERKEHIEAELKKINEVLEKLNE